VTHTSRRENVLNLLSPWLRGEQIVAGLGAFPPAPPVPGNLLGDMCGEDGCTSLIIGESEEQLAHRRDDHRRRCHGQPPRRSPEVAS
jgi:hypothetical protein